MDEKYWRKYEGRYDEGYEVLKQKRMESLKAAGMIPQDAVMPPNHPRVKPWDSLSVDERKKEARKMELYAGMVDNLDVNIGRLLQYLKDIGEYDNTLIVFMSDNGAAAEDFYYASWSKEFLQANYTDDYEAMGTAESFISYGPQWAEAGSAPFRYFKQMTTEGGMVAPLIISGPGVENTGEIWHGFATLMDIAPTFYELTGAAYPDSLAGRPLYPLKGESMLDLLWGLTDTLHGPDYIYALEHGARAMLRKGDWKIVATERPFAEGKFALYNLADDLAEQNDLKAQYPDKFAELLQDWLAYRKEAQLQFPPPIDEDEGN